MTDADPAAALAARLLPWFREHLGTPDARVLDARRASAGHASRILLLTLAVDGAPQRHVVRLAPEGPGLFEDYDVAVQAAAMELAMRAGCPVPGPVLLEPDATVVGTPFLVMPYVEGRQIGDSPAHDPWARSLSPARQTHRCRSLLAALAAIHRADASAAVRHGVPARDAAAEVAFWRRYLEWAFDGAPPSRLADPLTWCAEHVPEPEGAPVLLWGDVRPGNIIWTDDADVRAVLDWDMTAVGAREHDVAWLTTLEETMAALSRRTLPGQLDRAATVEHYEQVSGHALTDLAWYEVLAMVRSTAIMSRIAYLDRAAGRPLHFPLEDNPLLDLLEQRVART